MDQLTLIEALPVLAHELAFKVRRAGNRRYEANLDGEWVKDSALVLRHVFQAKDRLPNEWAWRKVRARLGHVDGAYEALRTLAAYGYVTEDGIIVPEIFLAS